MQLLFPTANALRPYSMLGLGDIVIPGLYAHAFCSEGFHILIVCGPSQNFIDQTSGLIFNNPGCSHSIMHHTLADVNGPWVADVNNHKP